MVKLENKMIGTSLKQVFDDMFDYSASNRVALEAEIKEVV
jgi:hypothetical protein